MIVIEFKVCVGEDSDGNPVFEWQELESFADLQDAVPALEAHRSLEGDEDSFRIAGDFVVLSGAKSGNPRIAEAGPWTVQSEPIPFDDAERGSKQVLGHFRKIGQSPAIVVAPVSDLASYGIKSMA